MAFTMVDSIWLRGSRFGPLPVRAPSDGNGVYRGGSARVEHPRDVVAENVMARYNLSREAMCSINARGTGSPQFGEECILTFESSSHKSSHILWVVLSEGWTIGMQMGAMMIRVSEQRTPSASAKSFDN
eukprot:scaffold350205_cov35-Attheya_sp.AAC.4